MAEPDFASFHRALHGWAPLPWQARLARRVVDRGWAADAGILTVGVPTGLGKTTCLDIAVWALAVDAGRAPAERRHPRRIWYVVDRRLLVDTAAERATKLSDALADSGGDTALAWVAGRLSRLGGRGLRPLHVASVRGGLPLGDRPPDPAQPALLLATPAMFGSRWFFGGYGSSRSMRPIDAALAGTDSLVLLDEAHLAAPLIELHGMVAACDHATAPVLPSGRRGVTLVGLTATSAAGGERFDLDDEDRRNDLVNRRLDATKQTRLAPATNEKKVAKTLAGEVQRWVGSAPAHGTCLVFANRPTTARAVFDELCADVEADVLLLTGRMREPEADVVRKDVLAGCGVGADRSGRGRPLVIVATQTLEVGADLDADHLVTETAGVRALTQRFGRLNRLGQRSGTAVVVHGGAAPLYALEADGLWARLTDALDDGGTVDLSPRRISSVLGDPVDAGRPVPQLLPAHLWEWAKTSVPPPGRAPIEVFLDPDENQLAPVQVAWRAGIRDEVRAPAGRRLWVPITADEIVEVPIRDANETLAGLGREVLVVEDDGGSVGVRPVVDGVVPRVRPGEIVVLDTSDGGYDRWGWAPGARSTVSDQRMRTSDLLPVNKPLFAALLDQAGTGGEERQQVLELVSAAVDPPNDGEEPEPADRVAGAALAVAALASALTAGDPGLAWRLRAASASSVELPDDRTAIVRLKLRTRGQRSGPVRVDAFDELSFVADDPTVLADHLAEVGEAAREVAAALGLDDALAIACRLAGAMHDAGKADTRFQRWLAPDDDARAPLAKSKYDPARSERHRLRSGWPRGGRHELLSLRLAAGWASRATVDGVDVDLVLHLVGSHHGWGRPSFHPVEDPSPPGEVRWRIDGIEVAASADLSTYEVDQPGRFRRLCERYGLWGLAVLEAAVRQSDHALSEQAVVR